MTTEDALRDAAEAGRWHAKTKKLVQTHPLSSTEIVEVVLGVWKDIFASGIGKKPFRIGVDMFPKPQIMGFFLHELIPLELARRYPGRWREDASSSEKDLVYIPDDGFSVEIKTSSHKTRIFGNRSYAQAEGTSKKRKSGYCLAVNFEPFSEKLSGLPKILGIRFGWLEASDWRGQKAATGQQANLSPRVEKAKLLHLFPERQL
jgi:hypothetical protein